MTLQHNQVPTTAPDTEFDLDLSIVSSGTRGNSTPTPITRLSAPAAAEGFTSPWTFSARDTVPGIRHAIQKPA